MLLTSRAIGAAVGPSSDSSGRALPLKLRAEKGGGLLKVQKDFRPLGVLTTQWPDACETGSYRSPARVRQASSNALCYPLIPQSSTTLDPCTSIKLREVSSGYSAHKYSSPTHLEDPSSAGYLRCAGFSNCLYHVWGRSNTGFEIGV
jgi:hypothetical protein